ncbi:unnamed protein product [Paramecium sonneborni]|uniref:Transmembrane protein n=1 Tax=Paramecium sonneborni TaxID=65129 RepID=A0A8S1KPX8_9CILI|nr:unnamed protein product [Paramecium sonneborni]
MLLIILVFQIVYAQNRNQTSTLIMQTMHESYHYDLLAKYSDYLNPEFEVINIEAMNSYTKDKALPNYTVTELTQYINSIKFTKSYQTTSQYNLKKYPITIFLCNVDVVIVEFSKNTNSQMDIYSHHEYNLVKTISDINTCTTMYGLFDDLKINIDCVDQQNNFINVVLEIILDKNMKIQDVQFTFQYYSFEDVLGSSLEVTAQWNNCKKKEIKYIVHYSQISRIFYCLYNNLLQQQDQIIFIEDNTILIDDQYIITVYVLDLHNFVKCNSEEVVNYFYIKQLVANSITRLTEYTQYEQQHKWVFSLLLVDRHGICKCGNLNKNKIQCDFLELQEGLYTNLYSSSYLDEITYIYVASEILLYKINFYFTYLTDQDKIEGYYYIKQEGYNLQKIHIYYDYLIVVMSKKTIITNDNYLPQRILFFQKKYNIQQYVPNYIIDSTSNYGIFRVNFDEFPGSYYLEYNSAIQNLSLHQLQCKHLIFTYDQQIANKNYLIFQITLQIMNFTMSAIDVLNLVISQYNDDSFFLIKEIAQDQLVFKSEQFNFKLNNNLLGPLLNYHEIEWENRTITASSVIEYIREIKFMEFKSQFFKVFSGLFVYNEINAYFSLVGLIKDEQNQIVLAYQQFKYDKIRFFEDGKVKQIKLEQFQFSNIDFFSVNILTVIIGDSTQKKYVLCYNIQFSNCALLTGDFLKEQVPYDFIQLNEIRCINDTLFAIPNNHKKIILFSLTCKIFNQQQIEIFKMGEIDSQTIPELENFEILDAQFEIIDNKLSFILLSDGSIIQIITYYSISDYQVNYKVINKIKGSNCIPKIKNSSKIFIQFHQDKRVLVYLCNENQENQKIVEYDLQNPYNPLLIRSYSLFSYQINNLLKPFSDSQVIYIPVNAKGYLAYSPFFPSPNILLHNIPVSKDLISAIPVIVNNFDTNEWDIFSMAFFFDKNGGTLFYLNSNPVYYSVMNDDDIQSKKMIMVYQQNQDSTIFKEFNIYFDYSETQIIFNSSKINLVIKEQDKILNLNDSEIKGAVEDFEIQNLSDKDNIIIKKNDILQLNQFLSDHYETLEFGRIFDILDMNQTEYLSIINSSAYENNLIFTVSQYYFIIYEKQRQTTQNINKITILKKERLTNLSTQLENLRQCRLSINDINQLLLYCYKYYVGSLQNHSKLVQYFQINFQYDYANSKITYQIKPIKILLGSRLQIETINPIKLNGQIFQFIKYNYENSQDQYELISGKIENGQFKSKQIIQSSTFDYNILGQLSFDTILLNDETILVLTLDIHELRVFFFKLDNITAELIKTKEEKFSYKQLDLYLFNSTSRYRLETIHLLDCQDYICLVLLGTPDKFFEFHLILSEIEISQIVKKYTYLNYFRCIHTNKQKPQIQLRENLQISQLVAACVKSDVEKNFFFEDKFDYLYDDLQVFVQIFHRIQFATESSPIRIYRFFFDITLRDRFHFLLYVRQPENNIHILFENDTYFLIDYLKQDQISFQIKSNYTKTTTVTGNLVLSNIFKKKTVEMQITFDFPQEQHFIWIYITASIFLLIILIVLGILLYLKKKRVQKKPKKKKNDSFSKSLIGLDDVLKEVILGEGKRGGSQTRLDDNQYNGNDSD